MHTADGSSTPGPSVSSAEAPPDAAVPPQSRSRRAVLAATLGALGGVVASALGRPAETHAAAGDPLVLGQTNFAGSSATRLNTTSSGGAFWMTQYGSGSGVRGDSTNGHGGVFTTAHPDRQGLYAQQLGAAGAGAAVRAEGGANTGVNAVSTGSYAVSAESSGGHAVYGFASNTTGGHDGGHFVTWNTTGYGVFARATAATGTTRGVYGDSYSAAGYGVDGYNPYSVGVRGVSSTGLAGVLGQSLSSGDGVYGSAVNGWSGYFDGDTRAEGDFQVGGNCGITGYLSVSGTKSFRIDHPVAPGEKYLLHYCTESNEVLNLYSGTATLDADGGATVDMPAWFDALNADVRYQLTPIGASAPELHVAAELSDGRFGIAGGRPGQKVSWQLTARRNDPWVQEHGAPVEVAKRGRERGTFLHPELYGKTATRVTPPLHPIRRAPAPETPPRA